jgi:hypothetical protein
MVTETVGDRAELGDALPFLDAIDPELVVPVVSYLASRSCTFAHRCYSACAGRFARVFIGLGQGWVAGRGSEPTADDLSAHLDEASRTEPFTVPDSIFDEVAETCRLLGIPL